jgi:hypothetical protein
VVVGGGESEDKKAPECSKGPERPGPKNVSRRPSPATRNCLGAQFFRACSTIFVHLRHVRSGSGGSASAGAGGGGGSIMLEEVKENVTDGIRARSLEWIFS